MIFSALLKPILKSLYDNRRHICILFAVHRDVFSQRTKMRNIICHHLGQHCTMPHVSVSAQTVLLTQCCVVVVSDGCAPKAGMSHSVGQSHCHDGVGQGAAAGQDGPGHGLLVGHACYNFWLLVVPGVFTYILAASC